MISWRSIIKPETSPLTYAYVFRVGYAIMAIAIFAFIIAMFQQRDLNAQFKAQLQVVNQKFEQMTDQHEMALAAGHEALKARDEIYQALKQCELDLQQSHQKFDAVNAGNAGKRK